MQSMRSRCLAIGLCLAGTAVAAAAAPQKASAPSNAFPRTVYLGGVAAVEQLRMTNPRDYPRVQRILASADQLCKPGEPKALALKLDAQEVHCGAFIFTSDPPQRQISFRLDDTRYIAMIFLTGFEVKLAPIPFLQGPEGKLIPIGARVAVRESPPPH
jgi:hypothetical protein